MSRAPDPPSSPPTLVSRPATNRKRARSLDNAYFQRPGLGLSSDPAFFSSDDMNDEGIENYAGKEPRNKVMKLTPYYGETNDGSDNATAPASMHKHFTRNVDSGVWMSCSSDIWLSFSSSNDSTPSSDPSTPEPAIDTVVAALSGEPLQSDYEKKVADKKVADYVRKQLDKGDSVVDLSAQGLKDFSGKVLNPLKTMIGRAFHLDYAGPNGPSEFMPLTAQLKLYLYNNSLSRLPGEIMTLQNLTVLSIRGNGITALPSEMGKLVNLVELNIASNKLRYLPHSLLRLFYSTGQRTGLTHSTFTFSGNPWIEPMQIEGETPDSIRNKAVQLMAGQVQVESNTIPEPLLSWLATAAKMSREARHADDPKSVHNPIVVASTLLTYLDRAGRPELADGILPSQMSNADIQRLILKDTRRQKHLSINAAWAPSLFEECLRMCQVAPNLEAIRPATRRIGAKDITEGMIKAVEALDQDGKECSVCGHNYIIPRMEWLEFAILFPQHQDKPCNDNFFMPFLRQGCTWKCHYDV